VKCDNQLGCIANATKNGQFKKIHLTLNPH